MKAAALLIHYVVTKILSFSVPLALGQYHHLGCFRDNSNRAIDRLVNTYSSGAPKSDELVRLCQLKAVQKGYSVFGVQAGEECWSGPDASSTYNRYGTSPNCWNKNKGGPFANAVYINDDNQYRYTKLGCFKDTAIRAIAPLEGKDAILDGQYHKRHNAIGKCAQAAWKRGYQVFAVENGGQCFSSATAYSSYNKYGTSGNCRNDGEGGPWAFDAYVFSVRMIDYHYQGCYKDISSPRALPEKLGLFSPLNNKDVVDLCYNDALRKGYQAFGVQYGGQCFTGPSAHLTYAKYGAGNNCKDSKGGTWANDVYRIDDPYNYIGCFADSVSNRTMQILVSSYVGLRNSEVVRLCYLDTLIRGWNFFGVQKGSSCWTGSSAGQTYSKHGKTRTCSGGTGAALANDVYTINVNRGYIGCEFGWTKYNGSCYKRFTSPRDWIGARDSCKQHGASLLRIEAQWKQDFVERFLRVKHANIDRIWIGLNDLSMKGDYRWVNNEKAKYFNWDNNYGTTCSSDCITMATLSGKWSCTPCYQLFTHVCRKNTIFNKTSHHNHHKDEVNVGAIVGGVVGGIVFCLCCCCKRKGRNNNPRPCAPPAANTSQASPTVATNASGANANEGNDNQSIPSVDASSRAPTPIPSAPPLSPPHSIGNSKSPAFSATGFVPPPPTFEEAVPEEPPPSYEEAIAMEALSPSRPH